MARCQQKLGKNVFDIMNTCLDGRRSDLIDKDLEYAQYYSFFCDYYRENQNYEEAHNNATELSYIAKSKFYSATYHEFYADQHYFDGVTYL